MTEHIKKVILTTGGKGGIGKALLFALKRQGYNVLDLDLYPQPNFNDPQIHNFPCDLMKEENIIQAADYLKSKKLSLSSLVHIAGISGHSVGMPFTNIDPEDFERCFNLHNKAFFLLMKHFLNFFKPEGASVIALSSIAALKNGESLLPYAASKAALNCMVECFARELAPKNIRVNAVAPGFVWTPLWDKLAAQFLAHSHAKISGQELFDHVVEKRTLSKKAQSAEDIANQILFLLKEESQAITGQILYVDGGASVL